MAALALTFGGLAPAAAEQALRWVGSWGASQQSALAPRHLVDATLRQTVHLSLGGRALRLRLSNVFGTQPLRVGASHVARPAGPAAIAPDSDREVTFQGQRSVTIPAGGQVLSDPIPLAVPALAELSISLYLPGEVTLHTEHTLAMASAWVSAPGDHSGSASFIPAARAQSWYLVTDVEVAGTQRSAAIVTLGDSITDGYQSTADANRRWPDLLSARLQARPELRHLAVIDEGISGNRVLHDYCGPSALARLQRDALDKAGVRYVLVLEGINDIGFPGAVGLPGAFGLAGQAVSAQDLIAGQLDIIHHAHALGLRIYGGTLTPFEGASTPGYYSQAGEDTRLLVNAWIRSSGAYDAVIDFDAALRDPSHPSRLLPAYDSGDHLHPGDAGYQAMADAIDLSLFR